MNDYFHIPVLLDEVLAYLQPKPGENFIDCTLGGGGYTFSIAEKIGPKGKVLAIDLDKSALKNAEEKIKEKKVKNIILSQGNFKDLSKIRDKYFSTEKGVDRVDGIVLDLGLSSAQLENGSRGFSFRFDAPLLMNFDSESGMTAREIVNKWPQRELEKIIREYGEEKFSGRISRAIETARKEKKIETTEQLSEIIKSAVPKKYLYSKIHPATRTFQALRIAVNDELGSLESVLPQALKILSPGGRLAVVSFHSLEDRIVKNFLKNASRSCICPPEVMICECNHQPELKILTKKPIIPAEKELENNPRARSAKLRAGLKM